MKLEAKTYFYKYQPHQIANIRSGKLTKLIKSYRPNATVYKYEVGDILGIKERACLIRSMQTAKGVKKVYVYEADNPNDDNLRMCQPERLDNDSCRLFIKVTGSEVMKYDELPDTLKEPYEVDDFDLFYDMSEAHGRSYYKHDKNPSVIVLDFEVL